MSTVLSGCADPQLDEVVAENCCCENEDLLCHDDIYTRGWTLPGSIDLSDMGELFEGFGVICDVKATGGVDTDILFPQPGDDWYQYCPTCSTYPDCEEPETNRICMLTIQNTNQPFYCVVSGYVEGYEPDPNDSSWCYFAVDPTYPIPEGSSGDITIEAARIGAHQLEYSGGGEEVPNHSSHIHTIPMSTMKPAKICKMVWAANSQVNVAGFEDAVSDAAEAARHRQTDVPGGSTSFIDRYNNYDEKNVSLHLVPERQTPVGIELLIDVVIESQEFQNLKQQLIAQDISVLVVRSIMWNGKLCDGVGTYGVDFMVIRGSAPFLSQVILHEMGHNCYLYHNTIDYNVMRDTEGEGEYETSHPGYRNGKDISSIYNNQASAFLANNPYPSL